MIIVRGPRRAAGLVVLGSLLALFRLAPAIGDDGPVPPPRQPPTAAQIEKLNKLVIEKGKETRLNNETTNLLGLTRNDELVASRGIAVNDQQGDIHQFEPLSDDRGYLLLKINPQKNTIYWVGRDFALRAGRARVPGQSSVAMSPAEAQTGVNDELWFWEAFADSQQ